MKRIVFTIIIVLLSALFFCAYSIPFLRDLIIGLGANVANIYASIDAFFLTIWNSFFAGIIKLSPDAPSFIPGTIIVGIGVVLLLVIVIGFSTLFAHISRNKKDKDVKNIKKELEALEKTNDAPSSFSHYDMNNVNFVNHSTPYVSLENDLLISSSDSKVNIKDKKRKPITRIILSVIYSFIVLFFIFIRVVWHHNYEAIYNSFSAIYSNSFIIDVFENLDRFFIALSGGIAHIEVFSLGGLIWVWSDIIEIIALLLLNALIMTLVLLLCHLVVKIIRRKKSTKFNLDFTNKNEKREISKKNLTFFGLADNSEIKADINYIAKVTKSKEDETKEKIMYKRASYIDDISEGVYEYGSRDNNEFKIAPSPVRHALVKENIEEDLSMNQGVSIEDIISIDDKNKQVTTPIFDSFSIPDEGIVNVDLSTVDVNDIATIGEKLVVKDEVSTTDDMISFDEDGYSYLMKEGKPFIDEEEDISDIIETDFMDKTAIVKKYGENFYSLLDDLEPFKLKQLSFSEEKEREKREENNKAILKKEEERVEQLTANPFKLTTIEEAEPLVKSTVSEETKDEENVSQVIEESTLDKKVEEITAESKEEEKAEEVKVEEVKKEEAKTEEVKNKEVIDSAPENEEAKIIKPLEVRKNIKPIDISKHKVTSLPPEKIEGTNFKLSPLDAFHQGVTLVVPKVKPIIVKPIERKDNNQIDEDNFKIKTIEIPTTDIKLAKPHGPISAKNINSSLFISKGKKE